MPTGASNILAFVVRGGTWAFDRFWRSWSFRCWLAASNWPWCGTCSGKSSRAAKRAALSAAGPAALPAEPRLEQLDRSQGVDVGNVRRIELQDLEKLDRFGQTSDAGYVHIPIQDAMDLVVKTLPVRRGKRPTTTEAWD